CIQNLEFPWTF
nr:immunoglobulin light chain junction region [Macaca mulatta]